MKSFHKLVKSTRQIMCEDGEGGGGDSGGASLPSGNVADLGEIPIVGVSSRSRRFLVGKRKRAKLGMAFIKKIMKEMHEAEEGEIKETSDDDVIGILTRGARNDYILTVELVGQVYVFNADTIAEMRDLLNELEGVGIGGDSILKVIVECRTVGQAKVLLSSTKVVSAKQANQVISS